MNRSFARPRSGAALLLSLWALFLLSAVVISWALDIDSRLTVNGNANRVVEAEAMAASGSEIAMHPAVKPGSPLLRGGVSRTQTFEARITGEGGRLNINWVVANALQPTPLGQKFRDLIDRYLEIKGVELNDRPRMIDCLLDWIDPGNEVRLNGAEAEGDYQPKNAPLTRIEEMKRIRGWEDFTANEGWDADFTLNSGTPGGPAPIDLRWASRNVLLALPGMTEGVVDQYLALRAGPDGIEGTEDDPEFGNVEDIRVALGFTEQQFNEIRPLVNPTKDPVVRVVSVGKSGDVSRTVQMVIRKGANNGTPQLISWKEL